MTPEQSKRELLDFIDRTGEAAGVTWDLRVGGTRDCPLASGDTGAHVPIWAHGPGSTSSKDVIERVQELWSSEGYDVDIQHVDAGALQLTYPIDAESMTFQFGINENASHMTTASRCMVGNADELNELRQRQEQEAATPPATTEP